MKNISCTASEITTNKLYEMQFQNDFKLCEAIVTRDGKFYQARVNHLTLIHELIKSGVDLLGAVRINEDYAKATISLSSLEKYNFVDKRFEKEKSIRITDAQAETLIAFYEALRGIDANKYNLSAILRLSENLGWDMFDYIRPDSKYYSNTITSDNLDSILSAIVKKYGNNFGNRRDLEIFNLYEEFTESNKMKRPKALELQENPKNEKEYYDNLKYIAGTMFNIESDDDLTFERE